MYLKNIKPSNACIKRACEKQLTKELRKITNAAWRLLPNYAAAETLTIHLELNKHTEGCWHVETSGKKA